MRPNRRELRAYARMDGSGRVVAGSLVLRKRMPKTGRWVEVEAYECCVPKRGDTTTTALPS